MSRYSRTEHSGTGDWLVGAVKNNPEGLLLLAAGCALLMRRSGSFWGGESAGRRNQWRGDGARQRYQPDGPSRAHSGGSDWKIGEGVSQAAESAREYASDMTEKVSETASSYASSISEQSARFASQAQSTMQDTVNRVLHQQPLAVALAGLAAGAAVAAAFQATDIERRTIGQAGERLADAAGRAGEEFKAATAKAGEELVTDGVKEIARDVAGAFSSAMSGEQSAKSDQSAVSGSSHSGQSSKDFGSSGASSQGSSGWSESKPTTNPGGKRGSR
jgi:hypothetical protein